MVNNAHTALEVILNILPIDLHLEGLAYNSALRLKSLGLFKASTGKETNFDHKVVTHLPTREQWSQA
ncbi:hypothetical protein BGY98DRAFT_1055217, partial [Russula aff. rugulosa BPL654]